MCRWVTAPNVTRQARHLQERDAVRTETHDYKSKSVAVASR